MVEHRAIQQQRRNRRDEGSNVEHAEKQRHLPCRVHLVSSSSELHWVSFVVRSTSGGKTAPLGHFLASDSETCSVLHTQMCTAGRSCPFRGGADLRGLSDTPARGVLDLCRPMTMISCYVRCCLLYTSDAADDLLC